MEETFDFGHFESRLPWGQVKWDPAELEKTFGTRDVLPAWIADMDLKTLPEVQEAIVAAAKNGMYGPDPAASVLPLFGFNSAAEEDCCQQPAAAQEWTL